MITWLADDAPFPPTHLALGPDSEATGLLAAGGSLSPQRLHMAYRQGIYPWFGPGQPIMWWSPDPRMVLPVDQFRLHRSLRKTIASLRREARLEIRIDHNLELVMRHCANALRHGQNGTWIVPEMQAAYLAWHRQGQRELNDSGMPPPTMPHSFEAWIDGELAGGLYGVHAGRMFFGESMFASRTDASKVALAALVTFCRRNGIAVIDCQQQTSHLAFMGAQAWTRAAFESHLVATVDLPPPQSWVYDDALWPLLLESHR